MPRGTKHDETELLLAVIDDDDDDITDLVEGMTKGELERLADHADALADICRRAAARLPSYGLPV